MKRRNRSQVRYKKSVWGILAFIVIVGVIGNRIQVANIKTVEAQGIQQKLEEKDNSLEAVVEENKALKEKLERSATFQTKPEVKAVSEHYIDKYFGAEAEIVKKVMACESGLDNRALHINRDGSRDMGLYQIHDEPTHRNNMEKMYGVSIEVGAYDFDISSKYAKFLWDRSRHNWVCYQLV